MRNVLNGVRGRKDLRSSIAGLVLAIAPFVPAAISQSVLAEDNAVGGVSKPAIKIPKKPADPRAANAYRVLDRHCARCHQAGRTTEPLHSDGIANILDLDSIVRDRGLVHPGLPDASRLYDVFVTRHAPLEVFGQGNGKTEPTPDEIGLVRQWIKDMPSGLQQCPDRRPINEDKIFDVIREAQRLERDNASDLRFFSLAHLFNACVSEKELEGYRQALAKLMNSLSSTDRPAPLSALDADGTVLAVRLSDYGWDAARWRLVQDVYPESLVKPVPFDVRSDSHAQIPVVNGDWFAAEAGTAPLYYDLGQMPRKLSDLAKANGIDIARNIASGVVRRAAEYKSGVTRSNRLLERHSGRHGGFWLAYDFATRHGAQNVFQHPVGPQALGRVRKPFKHDQVRVVYSLPNGFMGYALFAADGERIDSVLPGIDRAFAGVGAGQSEPATYSGANCMQCHTMGVEALGDDFRKFAAERPSVLSNLRRSAALPLFASSSEMSLLLLGDSERYRQALKEAGVKDGLRVDGQEIVSALADRYRRPVDLIVAAAEASQSIDEFTEALRKVDKPIKPLARRLRQGVLPRAELDRLASVMKGARPATKHAESGGFLRNVATEIGLSLWIDPLQPRTEQLITVRAQSDSECYLTIVSVDAEGMGTVLFPNEFDRNNRIPAGTVVTVPPADSNYQLRFLGQGKEFILGRCSHSPDPPMGIEHDFIRQKFTVLGNWENYVRDAINTEYEFRQDPAKAARARRARREARRRDVELTFENRERIRSHVRGPGFASALGGSEARSLRDGRAVIVIVPR